MPHFRDRLRNGETALGCAITYPAPGIIERIGDDWDWFWICMQHGQIDYNTMLHMVRVCDLVGKPAFVRVPSHDPAMIMRALDAGATGIIVPQVHTPDEARRVVKAAKFPPLGRRSYGGRRIVDRKGATYSHTANTDTLLMCQIESPRALDNAAAIAAVDGVDILLAGPDDISLFHDDMTMGEPKPLERIVEWNRRIVDACRPSGKIPAAIGMEPEQVNVFLDLGFPLIACGADAAFIADSSQQRAGSIRQSVIDKAGARR